MKGSDVRHLYDRIRNRLLRALKTSWHFLCEKLPRKRQMTSLIGDHKFNGDLLLAPEDQKLAARKYPTILHVLNHPELQRLFSGYNEAADRAKRNGASWGFLAIALVFAALGLAASEHLIGQQEGFAVGTRRISVQSALAFASAIAGIAGAAIGGMGILFADKKRGWLYNRLMTERIRQFHFQMFVFCLPEIIRSLRNEKAKAEFKLDRDNWFEAFKSRFEFKLDSEFTKTIEEESEEDIWLYEGANKSSDAPGADGLEPLFMAYRELRIMHQLEYVNHKLTDDHKILSNAPRRQAIVLSNTGFICFVMLCAVHILALLLIALAPSKWSEVNAAVASGAIWIALVALALRAIEQGLQPEREIERYQQYRSGLRAILERFDRAKSQSEKSRIMREMERLSFDEMRNFLITNERSHFVM